MVETHNAREATSFGLHNIMLIGPGGTGKTTQFHTLPRPGFLYIFDPNCLASLSGLDMEYAIFSPDILDINIHPMSTKKRKPDSVMKASEPKAYTNWEEDFEDRIDSGYFKNVKWIGMDSFTTFSDAVMDRTQYLNERMGKPPEQTDYTTQMHTIQNVFRSLSALKKPFFATAHDEHRQDPVSGSVTYQPVMTGRLRTRIPLLFSNILRTGVESARGREPTFLLHMVADRLHQYVRVSKQINPLLKDNEGGFITELDVTIPDFDKAEGFGLGSLLRRAGFLEEEDQKPTRKTSKTSRKG